MEGADAQPDQVIVRAPSVTMLEPATVHAGIAGLRHPRGRSRSYDIVRAGALRLSEAEALRLDLETARVATAKNGTYVPGKIKADEAFWRVVGLYIAEGHCSTDGRRQRLQWSFHPTAEEDLVGEVADFWGSCDP